MAVALVVSYLLALVVVRLVLARRWRGVRFVALDIRRWQRADWVAALLAVTAAAGLIGGSLSQSRRDAARLDPAHLLQAVPALAGLALMVWSQLTMGASWRIGVDRTEHNQLVTTGPYRFVRNPIYTAMVLFAAGLLLLVPSAAVAAGTVATVLFVEWQVRAVEEPFLLRTQGEPYRRWAATTGRFLPSAGPKPRPELRQSARANSGSRASASLGNPLGR